MASYHKRGLLHAIAIDQSFFNPRGVSILCVMRLLRVFGYIMGRRRAIKLKSSLAVNNLNLYIHIAVCPNIDLAFTCTRNPQDPPFGNSGKRAISVKNNE